MAVLIRRNVKIIPNIPVCILTGSSSTPSYTDGHQSTLTSHSQFYQRSMSTSPMDVSMHAWMRTQTFPKRRPSTTFIIAQKVEWMLLIQQVCQIMWLSENVANELRCSMRSVQHSFHTLFCLIFFKNNFLCSIVHSNNIIILFCHPKSIIPAMVNWSANLLAFVTKKGCLGTHERHAVVMQLST